MRHAIAFALALIIAAPLGAAAQQKGQQPPAKGAPPAKAPPAPAAKPYTPVAIKLVPPINDPSWEAFRKQLAEVASKKDRAALTRMVVAQGFFWEGDKGNQADQKKSGIDNLAAAIGLAGKQPIGWDMLMGYAYDPTSAPYPGKQGVICSPADPEFDEKALEELAKQTGSDPGDWAYPLSDGVEVRSAPRPDAPVQEKIGLHLVRIMEDNNAPPPAQGQVPLVKVLPPSGKVGYISADALSPLGNDQLCYLKEGDGWKITGFIGSGPGPQQ